MASRARDRSVLDRPGQPRSQVGFDALRHLGLPRSRRIVDGKGDPTSARRSRCGRRGQHPDIDAGSGEVREANGDSSP